MMHLATCRLLKSKPQFRIPLGSADLSARAETAEVRISVHMQKQQRYCIARRRANFLSGRVLQAEVQLFDLCARELLRLSIRKAKHP